MIGWCNRCDSSNDRPMGAPKCAREDCPDRAFEPAPAALAEPPKAEAQALYEAALRKIADAARYTPDGYLDPYKLAEIASTAITEGDSSSRAGQSSTAPTKLWLWKNFVAGRPEYWAFEHLYPVYMDSDDPQTLGEPCGYALFKQSRPGKPDDEPRYLLKGVDLPPCNSAIAKELIEQELGVRNWPANQMNAARAGWEAARYFYAKHVEQQPKREDK